MSHILIVDDNVVNLKLATRVLEAAGFSISQATDDSSIFGPTRTWAPCAQA